jgi:hypothetical protein
MSFALRGTHITAVLPNEYENIDVPTSPMDADRPKNLGRAGHGGSPLAMDKEIKKIKIAVVVLGLLFWLSLETSKSYPKVSLVLSTICFMTIALGLLSLGPWIIYSVITRKPWIERTKSPELWGFGELISKGTNCFLMGIGITILAIGLIFAILSETFPQLALFDLRNLFPK